MPQSQYDASSSSPSPSRLVQSPYDPSSPSKRPVPKAAVEASSPPLLPPSIGRRPMSGSCQRRPNRRLQSAVTPRDKCDPGPSLQLQALEEKSLRRLQARATQMEDHHAEAIFDGPDAGVISDFLQLLNSEAEGSDYQQEAPESHDSSLTPPRPECEALHEAFSPLRSLLSSKGAERLSFEVKQLKQKCLRLERERNKLQEKLNQSEEKIKDLQEDIKRFRQDPQTLHPAVQRLRKMGLNTPALAELGERWAGYVLGRTSMAMEAGNYAFRGVFSTHGHNGVLTEDSFKNVIRQFEPTIKSDQLTRLWYFADSDGSGQLDLFEFMRMFGCNANGDMSDEYFEAVTMHMYRKFHTKGGIRRVYAAADKDQDLKLSPQEWAHFLSSCNLGVSRQELDLTKQEMNQIFQRMNTSGTGVLTVAEFEAALEGAASKCYVSEKWVRDTFRATAVAVQEAGIDFRQLLPGTVNMKDFRGIMQRFMPRLRATQLDRLWKFVVAQHAEENNMKVPSEGKAVVEGDAFARIAFGHALGEQDAWPESPMSNDANNAEHADRSDKNMFAAGGTGREVLEQLASLLRMHTGEVPAEHCFDCLDPFLTPEHFHNQLISKFGVQYDVMKTKQLFSLIDVDRDGKITRYEFCSMFKKLLTGLVVQDEDACNEKLSAAWGADAGNEQMQVSRLLNRVFILESELAQLQRHAGHSGSNMYGGEVEPMVPQKQYKALATAHQKVLKKLSVETVHSGDSRSSGFGTAADTEADPTRNVEEKPDVMEDSEGMAKLAKEVADYREENMQIHADFDMRLSAVLEDNEVLHDQLEVALQALSHAQLQVDRKCETVAAKEGARREFGSMAPYLTRSVVTRHAAGVDSRKRSPSPITASRSAPISARRSLSRSDRSASPSPIPDNISPHGAMPARRKEGLTIELRTDGVRNALVPLRRLLEKPCNSMKEAFEILKQDLVGCVVQDRFRVEAIVSVSQRIVVCTGMDLLVRKHVTLKLLYDTRKNARKEFAYECCVFYLLAGVRHIPDIYHLAGTSSPIVFCAMELLQGQTLSARFEEVQLSLGASGPTHRASLTKGTDLISGLEAMEIADTLLKAVDECHQLNIINLGIRPDTIWISPPLSAARVRILKWEQAQGVNGQPISDEFKYFVKTRWDDYSKAPPQLIRSKVSADGAQGAMPKCSLSSHASSAVNMQMNLSVVNASGADRPFPNLFIKDVGALYYMPTEQLYSVITGHEAAGYPHDKWEWYQGKKGPAAQLDGHVVHWWQKGNGMVQTAVPVPTSSVGRIFEVEVFRIMTMVRRHTDDLGFAIGLTPTPPKEFGNSLEQNHEKVEKEAFFAGGDCAYYIRGERLAAYSQPSGETAELLREQDSSLDQMHEDLEAHSLNVGEGLRRGDRVCLVAEWNGDLVLSVNGEQVGRCARALKPSEAIRPLYGLVNLYAHSGTSGTDEHNVRAVALVPETQLNGPNTEQARTKAVELRSVQDMIHASIDTPLGPAVDVYACAIVLLQCFRGGREVTLAPAYDLFQFAMCVWISDGCPPTQGEFYLLSAIRDLMSEREVDLAAIVSPRIRSVLARGLKRSRYSRLNSCWEFAMALNDATGWRDMSMQFLSSHIHALEQAERRQDAEMYLVQHRGTADSPSKKQKARLARTLTGKTPEEIGADTAVSEEVGADTAVSEDQDEVRNFRYRPAQEEVCICGNMLMPDAEFCRKCGRRVKEEARQTCECGNVFVKDAKFCRMCGKERPKHEDMVEEVQEAGSPTHFEQPIAAIWDLRLFVLGHSHLTRIVQVLTTWSRREAIRTVAISRFTEYIPEQLQAAFVDCFNTKWDRGQEANAAANTSGSLLAGAIRPQKKAFSAVRQELSWRVLGMAGAQAGIDAKPALVLEDMVLPANELPADRFPLKEVMKRHLLWLVVHFVACLDLASTVNTSDGKTMRVGDSEAVVLELATAISRSHVLEHLGLRSSNLGQHGGEELAKAIKCCSQLRWLNLADNNLGPAAARSIVHAAATGGSLTYLDLSRNNIGDIGAQSLSEPLANCECLCELRLGQNNIGPQGGEALSESLLMNTTLTNLYLGHNGLTLPATLALLRVTTATICLVSLDLEHNAPWPSCEDSETLVNALAGCLGCPGDVSDSMGKISCLKALSLRHCNIRSASAAKLFAAMVHNTVLERLNMSWNGIRQVGAAEIVLMLAEPRSALQELDLRDNQLGTQDSLCRAFAEVFSKTAILSGLTNKKLRVLNLGNNELSANSMKLLVESLSAFTALEDLYLYHNPEIGVQGAQAISRLLSMTEGVGLSSLLRLIVSVCGLKDAGIRAIAGALRGNERLIELDISGNNATDACMQPMTEVIIANRRLEILNLSMNCIGCGGLQQLLDSAATRHTAKQEEAILLKVDVSAQAQPVLMDLANINSEVLAMFVGLEI